MKGTPTLLEQDRYQLSHKRYVLCMLCLILFLGLTFLSFYLLPFFGFGWRYNVPEFVIGLQHQLTLNYQLSLNQAHAVILASMLCLAVGFGYLASRLSNQIELKGFKADKLITLEPTHKPKRYEIRKTLSFGVRLLIILLLVFLSTLIVHALITDTTPRPTTFKPTMLRSSNEAI